MCIQYSLRWTAFKYFKEQGHNSYIAYIIARKSSLYAYSSLYADYAKTQLNSKSTLSLITPAGGRFFILRNFAGIIFNFLRFLNSKRFFL